VPISKHSLQQPPVCVNPVDSKLARLHDAVECRAQRKLRRPGAAFDPTQTRHGFDSTFNPNLKPLYYPGPSMGCMDAHAVSLQKHLVRVAFVNRQAEHTTQPQSQPSCPCPCTSVDCLRVGGHRRFVEQRDPQFTVLPNPAAKHNSSEDRFLPMPRRRIPRPIRPAPDPALLPDRNDRPRELAADARHGGMFRLFMLRISRQERLNTQRCRLQASELA